MRDDDTSPLDDTVVVMTPPYTNAVETDRQPHASASARARSEPPSTRARQKRQISVLVVVANARIQRVIDELRPGAGVSAYALTTVHDRARAIHLLRDPSWDAFVLDEAAFSSLDTLPEVDRLRILRSSVVITELGSAGLASMSAAECLPADRLNRFVLDDLLCRISRRKMAGGKPKDRDTLSDILWGIARRNLEGHTDLASSFRPLVETAARLLKLGRASVWRFLEGPKRLRCEAMYTAATGEFSSGIEVPASMCPGYCSALENHRILAIQDALVDPRSSELVPIYLREAGIGALLDAPIYLNGAVSGLFCCAHTGGQRSWTEAEQYVAASFSDYAQLVLMAHQRRMTEDVVRAQRVRMQVGQPLEVYGAMADVAIGRCQSLFEGIAQTVQLAMRDCAEHLSSDIHAHLLTVLASCEKGSQLTNQARAFSPSSAKSNGKGGPISPHEAALAVCGVAQSLITREVTVGVNLGRDEGSVSCDLAALKSALFSMAYQGISQAPLGSRVALASQTARANGRNRDCFEFTVTCDGLHPLHEFEAGLVLVASFATAVGATLEVVHIQGATRASLRIPLADTASQQRPRLHGTIVVVADVEEPLELVDMLRFFKYKSVVLSTQDSLAYLREHQGEVRLVVLDASNSDTPLLERLRPLRLATTRAILVIGDAEDCVGAPAGDPRLKVMPGSSLAAIAAHIEQVLLGAAPIA